jgi:Flp pilus assembly pilin Flp
VLGLLAEFIGVMLTAYGSSKLVLFGLDIDPRQLFPAFILAILVSGGTAVVSWVKELFNRA